MSHKKGDIVTIYELSEAKRGAGAYAITKQQATVSFVPPAGDRLEAVIKGRRRQLFVGLPGKQFFVYANAFLTFEDARKEALRRSAIDIHNAEIDLHDLRCRREVLEQLKEPA